MTWYIKSQTSPPDAVQVILCDTPRQVVETLADQRSKGRMAWIEDIEGRKVEEAVFVPAGQLMPAQS